MISKSVGRVCIIAGALVVIIGGLMVYKADKQNSNIEMNKDIEVSEVQTPVPVEKPSETPYVKPELTVIPSKETKKIKTEAEEIMKMRVEEGSKEASKIDYLHIMTDSSDTAYMSIDRLKIYSKVFTGVTSENLRNGVGRFEHSANIGESGNVCIAGHSSTKYNCILNGIDKIRIGDKVEFSQSGQRYTYKVDNIEIIKPTDIQVLRQVDGLKELTIITCAEQGKMRMCIQATLKE